MQHVYKRYGKDKQLVVNDFHLDIRDKEFLVFVGPSGCGKSTTLRMIAGLEDISEGEVYIDEQLVNHLPPKDRDIAMVFQNYALYPNMSVYENIAFGLRLRKQPRHEIDLAVRRAARVLEIEPYLERKPKELSGGQRQRVALGRAIVRNPKVFLMDEPLSNLDAKLRVQMRMELIKLHKTLGATFIYVTHDQIEAMTMADRIVVMKGGLIQQIDTPEAIYQRPSNTFVASFIGSPQINFVEGKIVEQADGRLAFATSRFILPVPGDAAELLRRHKRIERRITLGIRPEHIGPEGLYSEAVFTAVYKLDELMGADRFLHLDIGQPRPLVVRVEAHYRCEENERLRLVMDLSKALFFDADDGQRLT
ncbi:sugar ABC transporter ATP-binding protein [Paenibacillus sp. 598K]|nr:sugar ABC transporter ATP-binding protein [Paenibacillus sp. 598K]